MSIDRLVIKELEKNGEKYYLAIAQRSNVIIRFYYETALLKPDGSTIYEEFSYRNLESTPEERLAYVVGKVRERL